MLAYRKIVKAKGLCNMIFTDFPGKEKRDLGGNKFHIAILYFKSYKF